MSYNPTVAERLERLPKVQRAVYRVIDEFTRKNGYAPSSHDISDALGHKSKSPAAAAVRALLAKGLVTFTEGTARSVRVVTDENVCHFCGRPHAPKKSD